MPRTPFFAPGPIDPQAAYRAGEIAVAATILPRSASLSQGRDLRNAELRPDSDAQVRAFIEWIASGAESNGRKGIEPRTRYVHGKGPPGEGVGYVLEIGQVGGLTKEHTFIDGDLQKGVITQVNSISVVSINGDAMLHSHKTYVNVVVPTEQDSCFYFGRFKIGSCIECVLINAYL